MFSFSGTGNTFLTFTLIGRLADMRRGGKNNNNPVLNIIMSIYFVWLSAHSKTGTTGSDHICEKMLFHQQVRVYTYDRYQGWFLYSVRKLQSRSATATTSTLQRQSWKKLLQSTVLLFHSIFSHHPHNKSFFNHSNSFTKLLEAELDTGLFFLLFSV